MADQEIIRKLQKQNENLREKLIHARNFIDMLSYGGMTKEGISEDQKIIIRCKFNMYLSVNDMDEVVNVLDTVYHTQERELNFDSLQNL